jgi:hypothetical protein
MGTGGSFAQGKVWPGRDADHSLPSSAGAVPPLLPGAFMACSGIALLFFFFNFTSNNLKTVNETGE